MTSDEAWEKSLKNTRDYLDINECFVELPDFQWIQWLSNQWSSKTTVYEHVCAVSCAESRVQVPSIALKDNACVLSERTGERRSSSDPKTGSYFENVCARPQGQCCDCM
ncbi:hypothetical protein OSTOST_16445 [Ostertagia ostertagi]